MDSPNRIALTPTVARQTPKNEFGDVLKDTLSKAAQVSGALMQSVPGVGVLSAAVGSVTSFASSGSAATAAVASTGVASVPGGSGSTSSLAGATQGLGGGMTSMIDQMRAEADRSMLMQMQMQQESREYNTLSNVLKVRHDSAKSAINNIR